jgi:hypothetical protein
MSPLTPNWRGRCLTEARNSAKGRYQLMGVDAAIWTEASMEEQPGIELPELELDRYCERWELRSGRHTHRRVPK